MLQKEFSPHAFEQLEFNTTTLKTINDLKSSVILSAIKDLGGSVNSPDFNTEPTGSISEPLASRSSGKWQR